MDIPVIDRDFLSEFVFRTSRSSGKGGQNVNKVCTKVELLFFVDASTLLDEDEKKLIIARLKNRIRKDGAIHLASEEGRTQEINKKKVIERFFKIIALALKPVKKRIPMPVNHELIEKRKIKKIQHAMKKELRRKLYDIHRIDP